MTVVAGHILQNTKMLALFKFSLVAVASFGCAFSAPISDKDAELLLVHVIFRHGARTTYSFYPNDPYINETFYPIGLGGLTNEGKLGEYKLGRYLKTLYGDFLGEDYTEKKVSVRSTDVTRTKMSAQLVLAGLFPPSTVQKWHSELNWQPIPVEYRTEDEEDIFHPHSTCSYKMDIMKDQPNVPEVQDIFIKPYQKLYSFVEQHSGKEIKHPADLQDIFFNLKTEFDMNYTLPNWTETVFPEPMETVSGLTYGYFNHDSEVMKINSGYMLKKIWEDTQRAINNQDEKKIYLYSGHESTVGYMLNALGVYEVHVPPYGSAISFEIHRANDQLYVKLRYRNATDSINPVDLVMRGCDLFCPLETFIRLQKSLLPTVGIKDACNRRFGNDLGTDKEIEHTTL